MCLYMRIGARAMCGSVLSVCVCAHVSTRRMRASVCHVCASCQRSEENVDIDHSAELSLYGIGGGGGWRKE